MVKIYWDTHLNNYIILWVSHYVLQLLSIGNLDITEQQYYQIIQNKTAQLFEAGCELSALISVDDKELIIKMANFGKYLGMAFQIADDMLDYSVHNDELDKNIGDDLTEGKLTLPLIYLLENGSKKDKQIISEAIKSQSTKHLKTIQKRINETPALEYTQDKANKFAQLAKDQLNGIPDSIAKNALLFLCDFACHRNN